MSGNGARLRGTCPFCGYAVVRREGPSVVCQKGHYLVDLDQKKPGGIHRIGRRQVERG